MPGLAGGRASVHVDAVLRYRAATDGVLCVARCRELSSTGLTVSVERPVLTGELVRFDLERTPGGSSVLGLARVSWVGSAPEGADSLMRLRFLRMTEASRHLVNTWLEEVSAVAERPSAPSQPSEAPQPLEAFRLSRPSHPSRPSRPSRPSEDSTVRALSRAISESLLPPAPSPTVESRYAERHAERYPEQLAKTLQSAPMLAPPPQIPSSHLQRGHSVPAPPRLSAATLAQHRVSGMPTARMSLAPALSPPLPIGALIDAPSGSARSSTPPSALHVPSNAALPPPPVAASVSVSVSVSVPVSPAAAITPAPSLAPPVERVSLPLEGASLPLNDSPWSLPPRAKRGLVAAFVWPGTARAWILLCLLSVTAGGALAYMVYGSTVLTRALPSVVAVQLEQAPELPATQAPTGIDPASLSEPKPELAEPSRPTPAAAQAGPPLPAAPSGTASPALAAVPVQAAAPAAPVSSPLGLRDAPEEATLVVREAGAAGVVAGPSKLKSIAKGAAAPAPLSALPPPPPALPPQLAPEAVLSVGPSPAESGSRLSRARACLAKGDSACAIALLEGASGEEELELWIETLRAQGRATEARKQIVRYLTAFPNARRAATYRRILSNAAP